MIGQLASLLWEAECQGIARYSMCVTGDHSTPVEYGDHSYEPVPFSICHLKDFVKAKGGEEFVKDVSLEPFPLAEDKPSQGPSMKDNYYKCEAAVAGDAVCSFDEIAASKGCLGRFQGGEMMDVIKLYMAAA
jgi:2,3-bisphosphoglycerate-independent phosphoglycerate mutase